MSGPAKRYTVHIGTDAEGFTIQTHRWSGDELLGSGELFHRRTLHEAQERADEMVRHRHGARWTCVITMSDEAQAASA